MGLADPSCSPARRHRYGTRTIVSTCVCTYIYIPDSEIRLFGREGETARRRDRAAVAGKPAAIVGNTRLPRVWWRTEEEKHGGNPRASSPPRDTSIAISVRSIIFPGYGAPLWTSGVTLDPEQLAGVIRKSDGESEIIRGRDLS